jgi:hypothetical protein
MTQKLFALIIAASMLAQPITAHPVERTSNTAAINNAHDKGFIRGMASTLIASSLTMCAYLAAMKDNLYIPVDINPKRIPTGEHQWIETVRKISDTTTIKSGYSEPIYKTVWETNPLHTALSKTPATFTINGNTVNLSENMVGTISNYMPQAIAFASACVLFGVIVYYATLATEQKTS